MLGGSSKVWSKYWHFDKLKKGFGMISKKKLEASTRDKTLV
jgi:hypothetical protein